MSDKWTAGPWHVRQNSERSVDIRDSKRKDGSSLLIAEVHEITDRDWNARLIAAAPSMALLLGRIYEAATSYGRTSPEWLLEHLRPVEQLLKDLEGS